MPTEEIYLMSLDIILISVNTLSEYDMAGWPEATYPKHIIMV